MDETRSRKILTIDDDNDVRAHLVTLLQYEGFDVMDAENGRIGAHLAKEFLPDIIICDVNMPELDGYGVLAELRNSPSTAAIPFIFLTGNAAPADFRRGMSRGADDYLVKPVDPSELLATIQARLEKQAALEQQLDALRLNISHALPHELRTPLTVILGFTEFLLHSDAQSAPDFETIRTFQQSIHKNALRLEHLIEHYLLYTQLRMMESDPVARQQTAYAGTIDTKPAIAPSAWKKVDQHDRSDDLIVQLTEAGIRISEEDLQKIITELLDNACKFSERGTPIYLISSIDSGRFLLHITDRGCGMSQEQIAKVGAFIQFDRQQREQQGSGLGLVIARMLTQLHGGELTLKNAPDEGFTVTLDFPMPAEE